MRQLQIVGIALMGMAAVTALEASGARDMQFFRYPDQRGMNVFETSKQDDVLFDELKVRVGGQFALQFQALDHSNEALPRLDATTGVNLNQLIDIGNDFNLATANMDLDIQLADGVRSHLRTFLSSRHHNEPYVKGGYLQIDKLDFIERGFLEDVMDYLTIKVGHMEYNYGDAHFRRTDNSQALFNPFVGNYIMDSYATEVGAEVYYKNNSWMVMVGATNGKMNQYVTNTDTRSISLLGKIAWDKQLDDDLRLRFSGSIYTTDKANPVRLYSGDRAGSRYYYVTENVNSRAASQFTSGRYNPGLNAEITALMFNTFIKYKGLEFFGTVESAEGKTHGEIRDRSVEQYAGEVIYRWGRNERFYGATRYNWVDGSLPFTRDDIAIDRVNVSLGWFLTPNLMGKIEYVKQQYDDYPATSILHEAEFSGWMVETVVAF